MIPGSSVYTITVHSNGDTRLWRLDTVLPDPDELPRPSFRTAGEQRALSRVRHGPFNNETSSLQTFKKFHFHVDFLRCNINKFLHSLRYKFRNLICSHNESHQIYRVGPNIPDFEILQKILNKKFATNMEQKMFP